LVTQNSKKNYSFKTLIDVRYVELHSVIRERIPLIRAGLNCASMVAEKLKFSLWITNVITNLGNKRGSGLAVVCARAGFFKWKNRPTVKGGIYKNETSSLAFGKLHLRIALLTGQSARMLGNLPAREARRSREKISRLVPFS